MIHPLTVDLCAHFRSPSVFSPTCNSGMVTIPWHPRENRGIQADQRGSEAAKSRNGKRSKLLPRMTVGTAVHVDWSTITTGQCMTAFTFRQPKLFEVLVLHNARRITPTDPFGCGTWAIDPATRPLRPFGCVQSGASAETCHLPPQRPKTARMGYLDLASMTGRDIDNSHVRGQWRRTSAPAYSVPLVCRAGPYGYINWRLHKLWHEGRTSECNLGSHKASSRRPQW